VTHSTDSQPADTEALPDGLLTLNETAHLLGQPVEEVFRAALCGRLPVVWMGPRPYVDRTALPCEDVPRSCTGGQS